AAKKQQWLRDFEADEVQSKPIGFYTWNDTLKKCFLFLRFFQHKFGERERIPLVLAATLAEDKALLDDYQKAIRFYAQLSNPPSCLSVVDPLRRKGGDPKPSDRAVAIFPPSTSRETVLFEKLFPDGLPPNADLMRELVRKIRSGEVDLKPKDNSGW